MKTDPSAKTITYKDLKNHAWSIEQCKVMLAEAMEAERKFRDKDAGQNDLRLALGLVTSQATTTPIASQPNTVASQGKTRNVGKPNPTRRPTGE